MNTKQDKRNRARREALQALDAELGLLSSPRPTAKVRRPA